MNKHSKGSWIVDGNGLSKSWNVSNHEHSICDVTTSRADADLIAAAPELLEALEILLIQSNEFIIDGNGAAKFHAYHIAMKTIIKAKGHSTEKDEDKGYVLADQTGISKTEGNEK